MGCIGQMLADSECMIVVRYDGIVKLSLDSPRWVLQLDAVCGGQFQFSFVASD